MNKSNLCSATILVATDIQFKCILAYTERLLLTSDRIELQIFVFSSNVAQKRDSLADLTAEKRWIKPQTNFSLPEVRPKNHSLGVT